MASRKKGKKAKWQPVPLTDLLPETPGGMPAMPVKVSSSWADDVDDDHDMYSSRKPQEPVVLPTAPRAALGPGIDEENIPMNPPFVAYVSNLPFDVEEEDLIDFFKDMQMSNVRLPKDSIKLKGFGYVEFEDRQSLIDALSMTNSNIKGRRVRIQVSNSNSDDRRGRMAMGRDYGRREYDDSDRNSDWRSGPRDEPASGDGDRFRSRGGGGFDRGEHREDRESSASDNRPGAWREARAPLPDLPERSDRGGSGFSDRRGYRSDDKDREFSRFGDRGGRDPEGGERGGERGGDRGGDRGGGSSFGPRRNYGDRERDSASDWGNRLSSRPATSSDPPPASEPPRTRVKLNLQPRTKPIDPIVAPKDSDAEKPESGEEGSVPSAPAPAPVPAANIFGAAKPVDTTAREREIEERLAKSYAESKPKTEDGDRKGPKEGTWGRRNGEGRSDNEKERPRPTWRSDEERGGQVDKPSSRQPGSGRSDQRNDARGPQTSRSGGPAVRGSHRASDSRGPSERERKDRDREDGVPPMPKATDEQAPNFVASNKYSMLPEDADSDNSNN